MQMTSFQQPNQITQLLALSGAKVWCPVPELDRVQRGDQSHYHFMSKTHSRQAGGGGLVTSFTLSWPRSSAGQARPGPAFFVLILDLGLDKILAGGCGAGRGKPAPTFRDLPCRT
jgi:hypothetical protein